ncbi:hypothetical protein KIW84_041865 [Lathyrus oleraceus]|uniref:Morc S5 domain-containing protein n=1 Tax=Pisum sativum TaxID=3888 RepID=A0A9D4XCS7_PEA|nr:hypothetical protein KIW84_041865 [Pisum sativum]
MVTLVSGMLQADEVQPTHNKQDFERTSLFQKLEIRLKDMTWEYWDCYCHKIGCQGRKRKVPVGPLNPPKEKLLVTENPVALDNCSSHVPLSNTQGGSEQTYLTKRKTLGFIDQHEVKRQAVEKIETGLCCNQNVQTIASLPDQMVDQETANLLEWNKKLIADCFAFEKAEEELILKVTVIQRKIVILLPYIVQLPRLLLNCGATFPNIDELIVTQLRNKIEEAKLEYDRLLAEAVEY